MLQILFVKKADWTELTFIDKIIHKLTEYLSQLEKAFLKLYIGHLS